MEKDTHTRKGLYCNLGGYVFAISPDCCKERYFCQMSLRRRQNRMNILMAEDSSGPEKSLKSKSKEWKICGSKVPYNLPRLVKFASLSRLCKTPTALNLSTATRINRLSGLGRISWLGAVVICSWTRKLLGRSRYGPGNFILAYVDLGPGAKWVWPSVIYSRTKVEPR